VKGSYLPNLKPDGKVPVSSEWLKILVRGLAMTGAAALSIRFDILSTPIAFRGFRVCSLDNTKLSFIWTEFKLRLCVVCRRHIHVRKLGS